MNLDARELSTILAALRFWQRSLPKLESQPPEWDIATNAGTVEPLSESEIDPLCERINTTAPDLVIEPADRRWKCPECGSKNVQIGLPAWHYESKSYHIQYVETDAEADVMWWYCEDCGETDCGDPEEDE